MRSSRANDMGSGIYMEKVLNTPTFRFGIIKVNGDAFTELRKEVRRGEEESEGDTLAEGGSRGGNTRRGRGI
jgi:hypothetical protein